MKTCTSSGVPRIALTASLDVLKAIAEGAGPRAAWPHALELVRALSGGADSLQHHWKRRQWNWSRIGA